MSWKKNINRLHVGVWIEFSFIHRRFSHFFHQCQRTGTIFVSESVFSFFCCHSNRFSDTKLLSDKTRVTRSESLLGQILPSNKMQVLIAVFYYYSAQNNAIDKFKKAMFVPPLKIRTPRLRPHDPVHKGHLLTAPRSWKGHIPRAIWRRGNVIPACQYDFSISFSSKCQLHTLFTEPFTVAVWLLAN